MREMAAVILAAGKGTRMKSELPKVLHRIENKYLIDYVIAAARDAGIVDDCIVVGYHADEVRAALGPGFRYALQEQQLGTGHAVKQALDGCPDLPETLMILCGDTPLFTGATLREFRRCFEASGAACVVLTAQIAEPGSYGRIIRGEHDEVLAIVEARDATPEQLAVREINSGAYCFDTQALRAVIDDIRAANAQSEYYLTDAVAALRARGYRVGAWCCPDAQEIEGVNDAEALREAAAIIRRRRSR